MKKPFKNFLIISLVVASCILGVGIHNISNAATQDPAKDSLIMEIQKKAIAILQQIIVLQSQNTSALSAPLSTSQVSGSISASVGTPTLWCHDFNVDIKFNSRGTEVAALQTALQKEGYTISSSDITWQQFKNSTKSAVISFQKKYSITTSGFVGPLTRAQLNALYGCTQNTTPPPAQPTPPPPPPPPATLTLQWGAYVGDSTSDMATFESTVGKTTNLQSIFIGWGGSSVFPSEFGPTVRDKGKTLVIFWESYGMTLDSIISGSQDSTMQSFATAAKNYNGPIILAPFHEMNGNWDPWGGTMGTNTPAQVIAAWKRMHDVFVAANATNVKFAWDVNNESVPNTTLNQIENYYPGDAYVDYVAVDGFNFGNPWQGYDEMFSSVLTKLRTYHKPIYILSMASAEGTQKPAWITDTLTKIKADPTIAGWAWFNQNKEQNWLVNSTASALQAFKTSLP